MLMPDIVVATAGAAGRSVEAGVGELLVLVDRGDWVAVGRVLREIEAGVSQHAPLEVVDGRALLAPAAGLGVYRPLPQNTLRGPEIFLYAQVRNHGQRVVANGFEQHLVTDLEVLGETGESLVRDNAFGVSRFTSRVRHRDTYINVALKAAGLPSGKFTMRLHLRDRVGKKQGQIDIPLVVR